MYSVRYMDYSQIASQRDIEQTVAALSANGMNTQVVATKEEALELARTLIPPQSPVMTMTSETLRETGIEQEINESGNYRSLKTELYSMDRATQSREMQVLGASPEYAIGSVHAITLAGEVIIASNTGSQLPAYVYGSDHVVWVVGAQKIVASIADGLTRLKEYVLPLESERARIAYGAPGSNISKLLIVNREIKPNRIQIIIVKEKLGF